MNRGLYLHNHCNTVTFLSRLLFFLASLINVCVVFIRFRFLIRCFLLYKVIWGVPASTQNIDAALLDKQFPIRRRFAKWDISMFITVWICFRIIKRCSKSNVKAGYLWTVHFSPAAWTLNMRREEHSTVLPVWLQLSESRLVAEFSSWNQWTGKRKFSPHDGSFSQQLSCKVSCWTLIWESCSSEISCVRILQRVNYGGFTLGGVSFVHVLDSHVQRETHLIFCVFSVVI